MILESVRLYKVEEFGLCGCCGYTDDDGFSRNYNDRTYYTTVRPRHEAGIHCEVEKLVMCLRGTPDLYVKYIERHVGCDTPGYAMLTTCPNEAMPFSQEEADLLIDEAASWRWPRDREVNA